MLESFRVVDFAGPIGLLCILIVGFGEIRRWLSSLKQTQYLLGAMFGLVAITEMQIPIRPFEGIIIDLRIVPVILAGAFVGWRGLAVCLAMSIIMRVNIGGTGAVSGVAAILIGGGMGAVWARTTGDRLDRGFWQLFQLGLMSTVSLASVVFVPADIAIWFLWNAAPSLTAVYLLIIPIVGLLIQREMLRIEAEHYMREGTAICPDSGLLRTATFTRESIKLSASQPKGTVGGLLVIWPVYPNWLGAFWGSALNGRVQAAMALSLDGRLAHADKVGVSRRGALLVPLTAAEVAQHQISTEGLQHILSQTELSLSAGQRFKVNAKMRVLLVNCQAELYELLQSIENIAATEVRHHEHPPAVVAGEIAHQGRDSLFAKLDASLAISRTNTVRLND